MKTTNDDFKRVKKAFVRQSFFNVAMFAFIWLKLADATWLKWFWGILGGLCTIVYLTCLIAYLLDLRVVDGKSAIGNK